MLTARHSSLLVITSLLGMLRCNSILGIADPTCTGACIESVSDRVVEEAQPGTNSVTSYDPGFAAVDSEANAGTPPPVDEDVPPAGEDAPPADEGATPAGEGAPPPWEDATPAGEDAPPADEGATPADEDAPPAEEDAPPPEPGLDEIIASQCAQRVAAEPFCVGNNRVVCGPDGAAAVVNVCANADRCARGNGPACATCTARTFRCQGAQLQVCDESGTRFAARDECASAASCDATAGACHSEGFAAPAMGAASPFAVLAGSTTACTNASAFTGDVGVSPGTALTGFNPSCTLSGSLHAGDAPAARGHAAALNAFASIASLACEHNLTGEDLGGLTLAPGVYCFGSSVALTGQLTLDGGGRIGAAWAFQIGSTITTAANSSVVMAGGANACDVFWNVGSSATLGTGTTFKGNVLATASITLVAGSSVVGRALALNAAVTSDGNQVGGCSN